MSSPMHTFHIPVMGTAFTIDTPLKVAKYGVSSVVSIGDDELCETMREFHSKENNLDFEPITKDDPDYRAKRITAYLNLMDLLLKQQFNFLKSTNFEPGTEITTYFEMLSDDNDLKS